jgi:hypothetical protein
MAVALHSAERACDGRRWVTSAAGCGSFARRELQMRVDGANGNRIDDKRLIKLNC